jgi:8-amino-7-oxononanoate synthase
VSGWSAWVDQELDLVRSVGRWRQIRTLDADGPVATVVADGRAVTSFAGNDYLGLARHPAVLAAARQAVDRWGTGATASRLVVGSRPVHDELEAEIADWKGTEAALLLPTGYAANLAVLSVLGTRGVRIVSDELNHASIVDGCRLARAEVAVFRHGDLDHAEALVAAHGGRSVVVSDSVFSMDGDEADVAGLVELCRRRGAALVLDEAHAVFGPEVPDAGDVTLVRVGTCSKALASLGGFVAAARPVIELLVNRGRSFIFTTASTPSDAAAALAALRVVRSGEGEVLRHRLRGHVDALAPGHPSPILPVVIGEEQAALDVAAALADRGILVPAIRPPTVPLGTSRLRIALSAAHTGAQVESLRTALADLGVVHAPA